MLIEIFSKLNFPFIDDALASATRRKIIFFATGHHHHDGSASQIFILPLRVYSSRHFDVAIPHKESDLHIDILIMLDMDIGYFAAKKYRNYKNKLNNFVIEQTKQLAIAISLVIYFHSRPRNFR